MAHPGGSDRQRSSGRQVDPRSEWSLRFEPADLDWIMVDHTVRLGFGPATAVLLSAFQIVIEGAEQDLGPAQRGGLGPLLELYPNSLSSALVEDDGTLRLSLASGAAIVCPPSPAYEAWQVSGPASYLVVCSGWPGNLTEWT